jgi:hypothetical protein
MTADPHPYECRHEQLPEYEALKQALSVVTSSCRDGDTKRQLLTVLDVAAGTTKHFLQFMRQL